MTYNLKLGHKAVKFIFANRDTDLTMATGAVTNAQYDLTSLGGSSGIQATLSSGDIILGDRLYHGFFYPSSGCVTLLTMQIFVNGTQITSQSEVIKQPFSTSQIATSNITRSQPLFFSWQATAGDVLSIRYSKPNIVTGSARVIYSKAIGTNLFMMEVEK